MLKSTPDANEAEPGLPGQTTLKELFVQEESNLLRYAFTLTGRRAVAEEIVQEVFLQLHAKWSQVQSPRGWLYRSVRNRAFHHGRKSKREILQAHAEVDPVDGSYQETPDVLMTRIETCSTLRKLITELDPVDQELIRLKYFEGLKYREIGERTGLSVGNVGYRLHHILKQLACGLNQQKIDEVL
ncbi:MAG: RNA polymerase sigma factor [bacterium]|nr:RNA polymerase sigma factor [bacterium]